MLRNCLLECVSHGGQSSERDEGAPQDDSSASRIEFLMDRLRESQRQRSVLEYRVKELEEVEKQDGNIFEMLLSADPVPDGKPDCKPIIRYIKRELEEHRLLGEVIGPALTVRGLLALKTFQHQRPQLPTKPQVRPPLPSDLDTVMSLEDAIDFAAQLDNNRHLLNPQSTSIQSCSMCKTTRFLRLPPISSTPDDPHHLLQPVILNRSPISLDNHDTNTPLSEFNCSPTGQTPCCRQLICDGCFYPAVVSVSRINLNPSSPSPSGYRHLRCPAPNCDSTTLPITQHTQLATVLRSCGDPDVLGHHVWDLERAGRARAAVAGLNATPDETTCGGGGGGGGGSIAGEDAEWVDILGGYAEN